MTLLAEWKKREPKIKKRDPPSQLPRTTGHKESDDAFWDIMGREEDGT